jgi:hypothetical protein
MYHGSPMLELNSFTIAGMHPNHQ